MQQSTTDARRGQDGQSPYAASDDASQSLIDRFSNFDGTFHSTRDLRIEGMVKGTIECEGNLFVAEGANVSARVQAESISVAGELQGEIDCRGRLQILPSGRLRGKIQTETLVVNEGAFYEGHLEMTDPDKRLAPVKAPRQLSAVAGNRKETSGRDRPRATADAEPSTAPEPENQSRDASGNTTFIRRFGGPETPWEGGEDEQPGTDERTPDPS